MNYDFESDAALIQILENNIPQLLLLRSNGISIDMRGLDVINPYEVDRDTLIKACNCLEDVLEQYKKYLI